MESDSAPFLVNDTNFGFDNPTENLKKLKSLKHRASLVLSTIVLGDSTKVNLYKSGSTADGNIFIEYKGRLGLLIKYRTYHYPFLPVKSLTQTKLWRSKTLPVTNMFSHKLFFNKMLEFTGAVLSDAEHTEYGRDFWKRRLREAFQKKLNVALVDFGAKSFEQIKDPARLEDLMSEMWSESVLEKARFRQLRWLIWK